MCFYGILRTWKWGGMVLGEVYSKLISVIHVLKREFVCVHLYVLNISEILCVAIHCRHIYSAFHSHTHTYILTHSTHILCSSASLISCTPALILPLSQALDHPGLLSARASQTELFMSLNASQSSASMSKPLRPRGIGDWDRQVKRSDSSNFGI